MMSADTSDAVSRAITEAYRTGVRDGIDIAAKCIKEYADADDGRPNSAMKALTDVKELMGNIVRRWKEEKKNASS